MILYMNYNKVNAVNAVNVLILNSKLYTQLICRCLLDAYLGLS